MVDTHHQYTIIDMAYGLLKWQGQFLIVIVNTNNWVGPTGLDSRIYNLAMKLSRSGATPGLVSTNGRWKFEPGGAKQG